MQASDNCVKLLKEFEGFKSNPYRCSAGVATIGIGSTHYLDGKAVKMTDPAISEAAATALMLGDLNIHFAPQVSHFVTWAINQNQFDALVSFAYNLGCQTLKVSSLLKKLNKGDVAGAAKSFESYVYVNGKVSAGLIRRRSAEKALFLKV